MGCSSITTPHAKAKFTRISYLINFLNGFCPVNLKVVTVVAHSQSIIEVCRSFGQQDLFFLSLSLLSTTGHCPMPDTMHAEGPLWGCVGMMGVMLMVRGKQ